MPCTSEREIEALEQLSLSQLLEKHQALYSQPPASRQRRHLIRQIARGLQVAAEGGLSTRARCRAAALVDPADLSVATATKRETRGRRAGTRRRAPLPGTVLVRAYQGRTLQVNVLEDGFEYDGQTFRSLTAVTRAITGAHWNGYHFFGLTRERRKHR